MCDLFVAFEQDALNGPEGKKFILAVREVAAWAREQNRTTLGQALDAAAQTMQSCCDSPVGMDSFLLEIVWDNLAPELEKLLVPQSAGEATPAGEPVGSTPFGTAANSAPNRRREVVKAAASGWCASKKNGWTNS